MLSYSSRLFPSLITAQNVRLNVEQIKNHSFFYGVDWDAIREIDAPFVPHLRSITDTSYFPTEDLESVPDQPVGADSSGTKDLAFLGWVALFPSWVSLNHTQLHIQAIQSYG